MIIPSKVQERGNCSWKSLALLIQTILQENYGKKIEIGDGRPAGEGYELFKEFKYALIKYYAAQIMEMAKPENSDKVFYAEACKFAQNIKQNAERKKATNSPQVDLEEDDDFGQNTSEASLALAETILAMPEIPKAKTQKVAATPSLESVKQDWWRVELRRLEVAEEKILLSHLGSLMKELGSLVEELFSTKEISLERGVAGTLKRIKNNPNFQLTEHHLAIARSPKDEEIIKFLEQKDRESQAALKDTSKSTDLQTIANRMFILLATSTTANGVEEFKELKAKFLELEKQKPSTTTSVTTSTTTTSKQTQHK